MAMTETINAGRKRALFVATFVAAGLFVVSMFLKTGVNASCVIAISALTAFAGFILGPKTQGFNLVLFAKSICFCLFASLLIGILIVSPLRKMLLENKKKVFFEKLAK